MEGKFGSWIGVLFGVIAAITLTIAHVFNISPDSVLKFFVDLATAVSTQHH